MKTLNFYFAEYGLILRAYVPIFVTCAVFVVILLLAIFITRHVTDRHWEKHPEKRKLAIRIKLRCYEQDIERLLKTVDRLEEEKRRLTATIRAGREQIQRGINIMNGDGG